MEPELDIADQLYTANDITNAITGYKNFLAQCTDTSNEKKFYAHLRLGQCYHKLDRETEMLYHCTTAYQIRPTRAESLYELIVYYKNKIQNYKAIIYHKAAKDILCPETKELGLNPAIYQYKIAYEHAIIAYYVGERKINATFMQLFKNIPANELFAVLANYRFYTHILQDPLIVKCFNNQFTAELAGFTEKFVASSPCIFKCNNGEYAMNQRYVSYKIRPDGSYEYTKHIATINHLIKLSSTFEIGDTIPLPTNETPKSQYIGIEDVKIISFNGTHWYTGTVCNSKNRIGICGGRYEWSSSSDKFGLEYKEYRFANEKICEKNWVYIPQLDTNDKTMRMIYKWAPLTIGELRDDGSECTLQTIKEKVMPSIFSIAKGTSNGVLFNGEIWFVVHYTYDYSNELRQYYHSLAVFDTDMNILRYTLPFKFTEHAIEYCLGIIVEEDRIILSHSVLDRESYIRVYRKDSFNELFISGA